MTHSFDIGDIGVSTLCVTSCFTPELNTVPELVWVTTVASKSTEEGQVTRGKVRPIGSNTTESDSIQITRPDD